MSYNVDVLTHVSNLVGIRNDPVNARSRILQIYIAFAKHLQTLSTLSNTIVLFDKSFFISAETNIIHGINYFNLAGHTYVWIRPNVLLAMCSPNIWNLKGQSSKKYSVFASKAKFRRRGGNSVVEPRVAHLIALDCNVCSACWLLQRLLSNNCRLCFKIKNNKRKCLRRHVHRGM